MFRLVFTGDHIHYLYPFLKGGKLKMNKIPLIKIPFYVKIKEAQNYTKF